MGNFVEATSLTKQAGVYVADLDREWFIWGPFGGYLGALAMRAIGSDSRFDRPATFNCQYLSAGGPGRVEVAVVSRKLGRRAEYLQASVSQAGKLLLEAQSWIVADDLVGLKHDFSRPPEIPSAPALTAFRGWQYESPEEHSPIWQHIERRPISQYASQGLPGTVAEWASWLRLATSVPRDPVMQAARAVLWLDLAPWNAVLASHMWPIQFIAPTLDLTVQFQGYLYDQEIAACEWLLVKVESPVAAAGLVGSSSSLWSEGGKLVAIGTAQCLSIPKPPEMQ